MSDTFVEDWDDRIAWRKKCHPEEWPPPHPVQRVYIAIRKLLAERDRAHEEIDQLTGLNLPDDAFSQMDSLGGFEWLEEQMEANGCHVRPSRELRELYLDPDGDKGWEFTQDPVEADLSTRAVNDDRLASALLEMYWYEELKDHFVALATMCQILQVNPKSPELGILFDLWRVKQMLASMDEETSANTTDEE